MKESGCKKVERASLPSPDKNMPDNLKIHNFLELLRKLRTQHSDLILPYWKTRNKVGGLTLQNRKTCHKTPIISSVILAKGQMYRSGEQNKEVRKFFTQIEWTYVWVRFKGNLMREDSLFNKCWKNARPYVAGKIVCPYAIKKQTNLHPYLISYTKINSKYNRDLNVIRS